MTNTELPIIRVDGVEIGALHYDALTSAVVEQSIHVPDMFTLVFYDPDFELFDAGFYSIGSTVEVGFSDGEDEAIVTNSEITAVAVQPAPSGRHELVVTGLGRGRRLANGPRVQIYEEVTDADIVSQIAGRHGLTTEVDSTTTTYPWLIQETNDYDFLTQRAVMTGHQWWVSDSTLYFKKLAKDGSSVVRKWPDDLFSFKVRFSAAEPVESATFRTWDSDTQQAISSASSVVVGTDQLGSDAPAATDANTAMQTFASNRFSGLAPVATAAEAEALANSVALRGAADEVEARGVAVGEPAITAGAEIEIDGMGERLSGMYLLTSVDHVFRAGEMYVTRFRSGGRSAASLVDMLGNQSAAPQLGDRLVAGVVTSTTDPDSAGRVQVNIPTLGDDVSAPWARLSAPGAGEDRGLLSYPEIGDEVLLGFENGDPRTPIIIGGLWSKKLKPPALADEAVVDNKVETKGFYSRLGHKIELQDGTSNETKSVSISLSDGETAFRLGQDAVTLDAPKPMTITGNDDITITTDSSGVTINASTITIKSSGALSLEGSDVSIKGSASVTIEGAQTDVKASGMLNVQAGGIASVKGSMVQLN